MTLTMPGAAALLEVWEAGEHEHSLDRALTILCAFSGESRASLAALGVHRRDALLIESRILAFGPRLLGIAACTSCACEVELELDLAVPAGELEERASVTIGERTHAVRVPDSFDLAAAVACDDTEASEGTLRARCFGVPSDFDAVALQTLDAALERLCSPAAIDVRAACPACEAQFAPPVDIVAILWGEIATYARRLLDDVDALARRYGWSERAILALPDGRRRRYLEGAW